MATKRNRPALPPGLKAVQTRGRNAQLNYVKGVTTGRNARPGPGAKEAKEMSRVSQALRFGRISGLDPQAIAEYWEWYHAQKEAQLEADIEAEEGLEEGPEEEGEEE